jgi:hypothetical protein
MNRDNSQEIIDRKRGNKKDRKVQKHVKISKELKESNNQRSTSNNRPAGNKDKYKQNDTSGPITAKNSKLPDAFFDVNYKGKRSMKVIAKPEKKSHDIKHYKKHNKSFAPVHPPKSSHGKAPKQNNSNSPRHVEEDEENKHGDDDFRQGVKNKPKIITGKLPSAFSNPQIKYKKQQNDQYIKQIEDVVRGEEYRKSTQNTLEPLPITIERQNKMKRALNNGNEKKNTDIFNVFSTGTNNGLMKKSESSLKYDTMAKSQSNGFGSFNPIGSDVQINAVSPTDILLQQMVSLALIKRSSISGPIKKMLHVPSFTIYCVKEIPISSRDTRALLKKWIIDWETALQTSGGDNHLVTIHGTHWNSPEGCVSLIMEYMNGGSLLNLLESVGALPESILVYIAQNVLKGLDFLHNQANMSHNGLTMSQIMFDREGSVKVNLGV